MLITDAYKNLAGCFKYNHNMKINQGKEMNPPKHNIMSINAKFFE